MKKVLFLICLFATTNLLLAQAPQGINYQTVVRNSAGVAIDNQNVSIRFTVLQNSVNGSAVYTETHSVTTNSLGLVNLVIGQGAASQGSFNAIDWATGNYYVKTEVDVTGGSNYIVAGTQQLMSVPYALFANKALNNDDADADPTNELQTLSFDNNSGNLSLSQGNTITLPFTSGGDNWGSQTVQTGASLSGNGTSASPLNVVGLLTDNQTLSLSSNSLSISGGNSVNLSSYLDNTDAQTLQLSGNNLSISGGNSVSLSSLALPGLWQVNNVNDLFTGQAVGIGSNDPAGGASRLLVLSPGANVNNNFSAAIRGQVSGTDGFNNGVYGESNGVSAQNNFGLHGVAINGKVNFGVLGRALDSAAGDRSAGVSGQTLGAATINVGVEGGVSAIAGNFNIGVLGFVSTAIGNTYAMYAENRQTGNTTGYTTGLFAIAEGKNDNYSIDGTSAGTVGNSYGTTGWAFGQGPANYAIYGYVDPTSTPVTTLNYAGYFEGDVVVTGTFSNPSDEKLKNNLRPMNSVLSGIMQLNPLRYFYTKEAIEKIKVPNVEQYGFTAQNIANVFPELVKKEIAPVYNVKKVEGPNGKPHYVKEKIEDINFSSVNYIGLIPILTQAIQEQQQIIEELKTRLLNLENK